MSNYVRTYVGYVQTIVSRHGLDFERASLKSIVQKTHTFSKAILQNPENHLTGINCAKFKLVSIEMVAVFSRFAAFTNRYPVVRGMISYGTIWPTSSIIQQTMAGKTCENYDWMQVLRFSLYGGLFTAPTLYAWIRLSTRIWPKTNLKTAVTKAVVEQMTYGPAAMACFFFGMSLMEGKTVDEATEQVQAKFLPSYKVAICFWPFLQTINFCYVPEKNRVPVVSACSLVWCCFLAYMHQLQLKKHQNVDVMSNQQLLKN